MIKKAFWFLCIMLSLSSCVIYIGDLTDEEEANLIDLQAVGHNKYVNLTFSAVGGVDYVLYKSSDLASIQSLLNDCRNTPQDCGVEGTSIPSEVERISISTSATPLRADRIDSEGKGYYLDGCPAYTLGADEGEVVGADGNTYNFTWNSANPSRNSTCYKSAVEDASENIIPGDEAGIIRNDYTIYYMMVVIRDGTDRALSHIVSATTRPSSSAEHLVAVSGFASPYFDITDTSLLQASEFSFFDSCLPGDDYITDGDCTISRIEKDDGMLEYVMYYSNVPLSECNYLEEVFCTTQNYTNGDNVDLGIGFIDVSDGGDLSIDMATSPIISMNNGLLYGLAIDGYGVYAPTEATPDITLPLYVYVSAANNFGFSDVSTSSVSEIKIDYFDVKVSSDKEGDILFTWDASTSESEVAGDFLPKLDISNGSLNPREYYLNYVEDMDDGNETNPNDNDILNLNEDNRSFLCRVGASSVQNDIGEVVEYVLYAVDSCGAQLVNGTPYYVRVVLGYEIDRDTDFYLYRMSRVFRVIPNSLPATTTIDVGLSHWREDDLGVRTRIVSVVEPSYPYQVNNDRTVAYEMYYDFVTDSGVSTGTSNIAGFTHAPDVSTTTIATSISAGLTSMQNDFLRLNNSLINNDSATFTVIASTGAGTVSSNSSEIERFPIIIVETTGESVSFRWNHQYNVSNNALCFYNATPTAPGGGFGDNINSVIANVDSFCTDVGTAQTFTATYGTDLSLTTSFGGGLTGAASSSVASFTLDYDYGVKIVGYRDIDTYDATDTDIVNAGNEFWISNITTFRALNKPRSPIIAPYWTSYVEPATTSSSTSPATIDVIVLATPTVEDVANVPGDPPVIYRLYYTNYATSSWSNTSTLGQPGIYCNFGITVDMSNPFGSTNTSEYGTPDLTECDPLPMELPDNADASNSFSDYEIFPIEESREYPYDPYVGTQDDRFKIFYMLAINNLGANQTVDDPDNASRIALKRFSVATSLTNINTDGAVVLDWSTPEYNNVLDEFGDGLVPRGYRISWATDIANIDQSTPVYLPWGDTQATISDIEEGVIYYFKIAAGFATDTTDTSTPLWLLSEITNGIAYDLPVVPTISGIWALEGRIRDNSGNEELYHYKNFERAMGPVYNVGLDNLPGLPNQGDVVDNYKYIIEWDANAPPQGYNYHVRFYDSDSISDDDMGLCGTIRLNIEEEDATQDRTRLHSVPPVGNNCTQFDTQYRVNLRVEDQRDDSIFATSNVVTIQAPPHEPNNVRVTGIDSIAATGNMDISFDLQADILDTSRASYQYRAYLHKQPWSAGSNAQCDFNSRGDSPIEENSNCTNVYGYVATTQTGTPQSVAVTIPASEVSGYIYYTFLARTPGEHSFIFRYASTTPTPNILWQTNDTRGASRQHDAEWTDSGGNRQDLIEGIVPIIVPVARPGTDEVTIEYEPPANDWTDTDSENDGNSCGLDGMYVYIATSSLDLTTVASSSFEGVPFDPPGNGVFIKALEITDRDILASGRVSIDMSDLPAGQTYYAYTFFRDNCISSQDTFGFTVDPDSNGDNAFPSFTVPTENPTSSNEIEIDLGRVAPPTLYGSALLTSNLLWWTPTPEDAIGSEDTYYILYSFDENEYVSPRDAIIGVNPVCPYLDIRYSTTLATFVNISPPPPPENPDDSCNDYIVSLATGSDSLAYETTDSTRTYIIISSISTNAQGVSYASEYTWSNDVTLGRNTIVSITPPPPEDPTSPASPPTCEPNIPGANCPPGDTGATNPPVCPPELVGSAGCDSMIQAPEECRIGHNSNPNTGVDPNNRNVPNPACIDEDGDGAIDVIYRWRIITNVASGSAIENYDSNACYPGNSGSTNIPNLYPPEGSNNGSVEGSIPGEFPNPLTEDPYQGDIGLRNRSNCDFYASGIFEPVRDNETNGPYNQLNRGFDGELKITDELIQTLGEGDWWFVLQKESFPKDPNDDYSGIFYSNPYRLPVRGNIFLEDGLSIGYDHGCFISTDEYDRAVYCFGSNQYGQLGAGVVSNIFTRAATSEVITENGVLTNVIDIDSGPQATCVVDSGNRLYCWGRADYFNRFVGMTIGNVDIDGSGNTGNSLTQDRLSIALVVGDPANERYYKVSVGEGAICALYSYIGNDDLPTRVRCWTHEDQYSYDGRGVIRFTSLATDTGVDVIFDNSNNAPGDISQFMDVNVAKFIQGLAINTDVNPVACIVGEVGAVSGNLTTKTYCWGVDKTYSLLEGSDDSSDQHFSPILRSEPPRDTPSTYGSIPTEKYIIGLQGLDTGMMANQQAPITSFASYPVFKENQRQLPQAILPEIWINSNNTSRPATDNAFSESSMISVGDKIACSVVTNGVHGIDTDYASTTYDGGDSIVCWGYDGNFQENISSANQIERLGVSIGGASSRRLGNINYDCLFGVDVASYTGLSRGSVKTRDYQLENNSSASNDIPEDAHLNTAQPCTVSFIGPQRWMHDKVQYFPDVADQTMLDGILSEPKYENVIVQKYPGGTSGFNSNFNVPQGSDYLFMQSFPTPNSVEVKSISSGTLHTCVRMEGDDSYYTMGATESTAACWGAWNANYAGGLNLANVNYETISSGLISVYFSQLSNVLNTTLPDSQIYLLRPTNLGNGSTGSIIAPYQLRLDSVNYEVVNLGSGLYTFINPAESDYEKFKKYPLKRVLAVSAAYSNTCVVGVQPEDEIDLTLSPSTNWETGPTNESPELYCWGTWGGSRISYHPFNTQDPPSADNPITAGDIISTDLSCNGGSCDPNDRMIEKTIVVDNDGDGVISDGDIIKLSPVMIETLSN